MTRKNAVTVNRHGVQSGVNWGMATKRAYPANISV